MIMLQMVNQCRVVYNRVQRQTNTERARAGGITRIPYRKNFPKLTSSPSRRKAISHKIVASEPVTERFGPRSTPISTAFRSTFETAKPEWIVAGFIALAATRPTGRLFAAFASTLTPKAADKAPSVGPSLAAAVRAALLSESAPAGLTASTRTNNPATKGSTLHEMSLRIARGA